MQAKSLLETQLNPPQMGLDKLFFKSSKLALLMALGLIVLTGAFLALALNYKINQFFKLTGENRLEFTRHIKSGWNKSPLQTNGVKNILILGKDATTDRGDVPPLTDTMMLITLNLQTGKIASIAFPRDLWSHDYQTKINALYSYGFDRYPDDPARFPKEVIQELTDVTIHHTLVLSLNNLSELIDLVGGIEIEVKAGFIDTEFPRSGVDIYTVTDPELLYETVEFKPGPQHLDGQTALKFIRSRKSQNDEGTDLARSHRQSQVIQALVAKMIQLKNFTNIKTAAQIYDWYQEVASSSISLEEVVSTAHQLLPVRKNLIIKPESLSVYPDDPQGLITHPPVTEFDGQWVYVIRENDTFKSKIQELTQ